MTDIDTQRCITLAGATRALTAAMEHAASSEVPVCVAVVDRGGNLVSFARMDGAPLMSAQLAQAMDATTPNPYVVQRALGDGQRSIPLNDLFALATAADAAKLIVVFVGYERFDRMLVTVKLFAREGNSWAPRESGTRSWTDTPFSDDNPPAVAFRALIPQILEFAAVAPRSRAKAEAPQTAA